MGTLAAHFSVGCAAFPRDSVPLCPLCPVGTQRLSAVTLQMPNRVLSGRAARVHAGSIQTSQARSFHNRPSARSSGGWRSQLRVTAQLVCSEDLSWV